MERKEAIEVIKKNWPDSSFTMLREALETLIPELKESEGERIRKELIAEVKEQIDCIPAPDCRDKEDEKALKKLNKWLAWLEKQVEQKPADKYNIRGIKSKHAEGKLGEMIKEMKSANKIEPKFNVDDIISNGISEVKIVSIESNYYNVTNYEIENDAHICNWVVYFKDQDNWKLKDRVQPQSKQEWSEEDKEYMSSALRMIEHCGFNAIGGLSKGAVIDWLKSLRPQKQWKPSEEQMEALKTSYLYWMGMTKEVPYTKGLESLYEQLKKLKC